MKSLFKNNFTYLHIFAVFFTLFANSLALTNPAVTLAAERITVQGKVGPSVPQLNATLSADKSTAYQDDVITYTLKYSTETISAFPMTVTAHWGFAHPSSDPDSQLDILEYEEGSASTGFGSATPIINTLQRNITWTIPNFTSSDGEQTVSFRLKVSQGISSTTPTLLLQTSSYLSAGETAGISSVVDHTLLHRTNTTSPTPTPSPSSSSPAPTLFSSVQTTQDVVLNITLLRLRSLSHDSATYQLQLQNPSSIRVVYGQEPNNLTRVLIYPQNTTVHSILFENLTPGTTYYFKVLSFSGAPLNTQGSSTHTFTTATQSARVYNNVPQTILLSQGGKIISTYLDPTKSLQDQLVKVIGLAGFSLDMSLQFSPSDRQVQGQAHLLNPSAVLRASSEQSQLLSTNRSQLQQDTAAVVNTELMLPQESGKFIATIQLHDEKGNIVEQPIAEAHLITPLKVVDSSSRTPIASAKVQLLKLNDRTQLYEPVPLGLLTLMKERRTSPNGEVIFIPYQGKYQATIHHIDFQSQTVAFEINPNLPQDLPIVELKQKTFNPMYFFRKHVVRILEKIQQLLDEDTFWTSVT